MRNLGRMRIVRELSFTGGSYEVKEEVKVTNTFGWNGIRLPDETILGYRTKRYTSSFLLECT